jgi:N-acetylmuramate 1-kinase
MSFLTDTDLIYHTQRNVLGWEGIPVDLAAITKGGSDRNYWRVTPKTAAKGPASVILMHYTLRRADNLSFFPSTEVLRGHGIRCPRVFAHDPDHYLAWCEDLGADDLWSWQTKDKQEQLSLYRNALEMAGRLHNIQRGNVPTQLERHLQPDFDYKLYHWEQDYFFQNFAEHFSALTMVEREQVRRHKEFSEMAHSLADMPRFLVHRDFQSQNIIVRNEETYFIDHQGLRGGRPEYDVASLLYDPYVPLTDEERDELFGYYLENRPQHDKFDSNQEIFAMCAAQRLMQALGAYGKLGITDRKVDFLRHIPKAVKNLQSILTAFPKLLPGLDKILEIRHDIPQELLFSGDDDDLGDFDSTSKVA